MRHERPHFEIPGGVHKGEVDPQGRLVRTDQYSWFQGALSRLNPKLFLAWDRTTGRWCLIREDRECLRGVVPGVEASPLGYYATVHTVVEDICWATKDELHKVHLHYRAPSEAILSKVARAHPRQYEFDNSSWASNAITETGISNEKKTDNVVQDDLDGTWEEAAFHLDTSSSTPEVKIRSAVPSSFGDDE